MGCSSPSHRTGSPGQLDQHFHEFDRGQTAVKVLPIGAFRRGHGTYDEGFSGLAGQTPAVVLACRLVLAHDPLLGQQGVRDARALDEYDRGQTAVKVLPPI